MVGAIRRYWLATAIGGAIVLAVIAPGPAKILPQWHVLDIGVMVIMFLGSLKIAPGRFREAAFKFRVIALSLLVVFVAAPLLSLAIGAWYGFASPADRLAILLCATQASTMATGIVLTEIAGGDVALAMVITICNNLATTALTPLGFRVFGQTEIGIDYVGMGWELAAKVVLPVIVGQCARPLIGAFAMRHSRALSICSQLIILLYIYIGVVAGLGRLSGQMLILPALLGFAITFHLALICGNGILGRLFMRTSPERTAFVLCSSQKTLPTAMLIWQNYLPNLPLGPLVAVSYHLAQLVLDSILAPGFKSLPLIRGGAAGPPSKSERLGSA